MNLREYLEHAERKVARETFRPPADADDARAFQVDVRFCSRSDLEAMRRTCMTKVLNKQTRQLEDQPNLPKLRGFLAEQCLADWAGLTYGVAASLCNLVTPNGDRGAWAPKPVEFSTENATMLLERALGFEDWVWERVTALADDREREEAREKNVSGDTRPGSSTT